MQSKARIVVGQLILITSNFFLFPKLFIEFVVRNNNNLPVQMKNTIVFLLLGLLAISCSDDETHQATATATLRLQFTHLVKGEPLQLNTGRYTNAAGNLFSVSEFNYYISNVKLRNRETGDFYLEPESYHLIRSRSDNAGQQYFLEISDIPAQRFTEMEFSIGVDNAKNYSIDHIGDLDPFNNNMVWDWNTGYKFLLLEGIFTPKVASRKDWYSTLAETIITKPSCSIYL